MNCIESIGYLGKAKVYQIHCQRGKNFIMELLIVGLLQIRTFLSSEIRKSVVVSIGPNHPLARSTRSLALDNNT